MVRLHKHKKTFPVVPVIILHLNVVEAMNVENIFSLLIQPHVIEDLNESNGNIYRSIDTNTT
jgi:hypothetical protein